MAKKNNHIDCECAACKYGMEAVEKMQEEAIKKYGWYAHFVQDDPRCPANTNAHTHHVMESFGHKDFQICLNIRPELSHMILADAISQVKKGVKFEPGKKYDKIIANYQVEFIEAIETGRPVLRILIPDKNGKYEGMYAEQLTKLNNAEINHNLN
jgi:hypothetical protein